MLVGIGALSLFGEGFACDLNLSMTALSFASLHVTFSSVTVIISSHPATATAATQPHRHDDIVCHRFDIVPSRIYLKA